MREGSKAVNKAPEPPKSSAPKYEDSPFKNSPDEGQMTSKVCDLLDDMVRLAMTGMSQITPAYIEQNVKKIAYESGYPENVIRDTLHRGAAGVRRRHILKHIEPMLLDMGVQPFVPDQKHSEDFTPKIPEPEYVEAKKTVTVNNIAKVYLMELGYKGIYPDCTVGKNMLVQVIIRSYNECFCPVDETLKIVYAEAQYLKACTEFMAALAEAMDTMKGYKVEMKE
jgi:hypothetical protein